MREVSNEEGNRLLRIVRRSSGSVVTWRRAQMVLLSVQGMGVAGIAKVTFTSPDRVREVINNFDEDGFESLYPKYAGGRPPTFTLPQRQQIKKIALSRPTDHGLPFSTWSLSKLAEFLVAEGVVDDISHEGLRVLLRKEEVSFQAIKTFKQSNDPDYEAKKNRVLELYDIAEGKAKPKRPNPLEGQSPRRLQSTGEAGYLPSSALLPSSRAPSTIGGCGCGPDDNLGDPDSSGRSRMPDDSHTKGLRPDHPATPQGAPAGYGWPVRRPVRRRSRASLADVTAWPYPARMAK